MSIDVGALRARFPSLALTQNDRPFVYFDGPGGTQVPDTVIDAVVHYYRETNANHEGAFLTSRRSDEVVAEAHQALADFVGAATPDEIKIGPNMTTLTLHLSRSILATMEPGDEIVVTALDHNANIDPWRTAARDRGVTVRTIDVRPDDLTLDQASIAAVIGPRTRLVAVGYASNAVGTINPVTEIARRAHAVGAWIFVDAVHWGPHGPIDVQALDVDFLACSVYKFFGPHLGVLYGRRELLESLPSYKIKPASDRYETGTGTYELFGGATAAVDYLADIGRELDPSATDRRAALLVAMSAIRDYELDLWARLARGLREIRGLRLWGIDDPARSGERTPTAAVTIEGHTPASLAAALGDAGIATWNGDFYARDLVERLGAPVGDGFLRIGLVHYNTAEEVDRLLGELERIVG
jgi:cysteine desulfurase family protein (TIGR01976 family)